MSDTKEKILKTALKMFAEKGYEAVSVSEISGELGITKGALYRHYKNKRDIFDSIVGRMFTIDEENSKKHSVPDKKYEDEPGSYEDISFESLKEFTVSQFRFWTGDEFASDFRKMLMLEQYRNPEIAELYRNCLTSGPVSYTEDIFRKMAENGILKPDDPKRLAVEFYAPMFLLINMSDGTPEKAEAEKLLKQHIEQFIKEKGME